MIMVSVSSLKLDSDKSLKEMNIILKKKWSKTNVMCFCLLSLIIPHEKHLMSKLPAEPSQWNDIL